MINASFLPKKDYPIQFSSFLIFILFTALLIGCNDDPKEIGLNILPGSDLINVDDTTLLVEAYTIGPEAVMVIDSTAFPIGKYSDPVFGLTKAGFMIEFTQYHYPVVDTFLVAPEAVADSVILELYYSGDSVKYPQIEVYALTEGISKFDRYYTDYDYSGKFEPVNLIQDGTKKPDTTLRLKMFLDTNFGTEFIHTAGISDPVLYNNIKIDSVFDANFKGLYFTPKENSDNIIITVYNIKLTVYFHTNTDSSENKIFYFIPQNGSGTDLTGKRKLILGDKFIKLFEHVGYSYTADEINQGNEIYLQSLAGPQALIKIPDMESLKTTLGKVIINRAELIIPVVSDSADLADYSFLPYQSYQLGISQLNGNYVSDDDNLYSETEYDSKINKRITVYKSNLNGRIVKSQTFNIYLTRYFQDYFNERVSSSSFKLFSGKINSFSRHTDYNTSSLNRIVLGSGTNTDKKIRLKLVYTKL